MKNWIITFTNNEKPETVNGKDILDALGNIEWAKVPVIKSVELVNEKEN